MKTLRSLLILPVLIFALSCDTNDDGFYNETYVEIPNLVQIQTQPSFAVGDHLFVDANFSRYLTESGESLPLDIYRTSNGALSFDFSYTLEKNIGGEWQPVALNSSDIIVNEGDYLNVTSIYAYAEYNAVSEMYEYNVGIPLASAGEYRLGVGSQLGSSKQAELRSRSEGNNLKLNISSTVPQLGSDGFYNFTVN